MKYLALVRHAKTRKADFGEDDHARPLLPEGEIAAIDLGKRLGKDGRIPRLILSSDSLRTRQTTLLVRQGLAEAGAAIDRDAEFLSSFYQADPETILAVLSGHPEDSIMVVGHNPCMEETVETLAGRYEHMRPGSCLWMAFEINEWEELYSRPLPVDSHFYRSHDH